MQGEERERERFLTATLYLLQTDGIHSKAEKHSGRSPGTDMFGTRTAHTSLRQCTAHASLRQCTAHTSLSLRQCNCTYMFMHTNFESEFSCYFESIL